MFLRIASHTVGERAVGYFHFRTVDKDSLIEIVDLLLQFDRMMVSVSFGSEYWLMLGFIAPEYQQISDIQKLQVEQYIFCLFAGETAA